MNNMAIDTQPNNLSWKENLGGGHLTSQPYEIALLLLQCWRRLTDGNVSDAPGLMELQQNGCTAEKLLVGVVPGRAEVAHPG